MTPEIRDAKFKRWSEAIQRSLGWASSMDKWCIFDQFFKLLFVMKYILLDLYTQTLHACFVGNTKLRSQCRRKVWRSGSVSIIWWALRKVVIEGMLDGSWQAMPSITTFLSGHNLVNWSATIWGCHGTPRDDRPEVWLRVWPINCLLNKKQDPFSLHRFWLHTYLCK